MYASLGEFVEALDRAGHLVRIHDHVDPILEIAQITDLVSKARAPGPYSAASVRTDPRFHDRGGHALLFTNVKGSDFPLLINAYGSYTRTEMALGCANDEGFEGVGETIGELVKPEPPRSLGEAIAKAKQFAPLLKIGPKRSKKSGACQQVVRTGNDIDLTRLPILRCWPLDGDLAKQINRAITDEIRASVTPIRQAIPFTPMWHGVRGRDFLRETFRTMIPERRAKGGDDFFSQMCNATDEDGKSWTEDEILNQFNLLIMAAHDTTATSLSVMMAALGTHPDWQVRLSREVAALGSGPLDEDALKSMTETDKVFREALRLVPPVPFIPRKAVRDFHWHGYDIPAGTSLALNPGVTMLSPELYTNPPEFDPDRFSPERAEDQKHRFAWTPVGGGAHKCIGMHFARTQVKLFIATMLQDHQFELPNGAPEWQRMPIPKPKGGLPIILRQQAQLRLVA